MRDLVVVTPDLFGSHGGIARIARAMTLACAEWAKTQGMELSVLSLLDKRETAADRRYMPIGSYRAFGGDRVSFGAAVVARRLRRSPTVFMHVNLAVTGLASPAPYSIVAHGLDVWSPLPVHRRLALRVAKSCWAISDYTAKTIVDLHGVAERRAHTLRNCLDPFFSPRHAASRERFVLIVTRLGAGDLTKGVDHVIESFARIADRHPDVSVRVVGQGPDRARLESIARARGVEARVQFLGGVDDDRLQELYATCCCFALPSLKEGFGLVYLEAMASGAPVLAARATAVPEVVADQETGILVDPGDVDALAAALDRVLSEPETCDRMGRAGMQRVRERYSFEVYRDNVSAALDALVD